MAYRILVVDDDAGARAVLTAFLAQEGHRVETAGNGLEALEVLTGRSYDVILSDLRMPGMGGDELYRRIERGWPHRSAQYRKAMRASLDPTRWPAEEVKLPWPQKTEELILRDGTRVPSGGSAVERFQIDSRVKKHSV